MTAALACARAHIGDVSWHPVGSDTVPPVSELPPNATRVLYALGLKEPLLDNAYAPLSTMLRTTTGYLIANRPLGPFVNDRYGSSHLFIATDVLCALLSRAMADLGIRMQSPGDTDAPGADLVIIATDARSPLRTQITGDSVTKDSPWQFAWARSARNLPLPIDWLGESCYARQLPAGNRTDTLLIVRATPPPERLRELCAGDTELHWARTPLDPGNLAWHQGNHVFIGDAAHPLLPFSPQALALAIEDAWVLVRMLDQHGEAFADAFMEYEHYRRPRARAMQQRAEQIAARCAERHPLARFGDRLKESLGFRLLPEIAMQQDDWQFEYDCVRGFD
ncbi:MAG: FAD-dependent monooxygenase [Pseudomonadales bacterium]